MISEAHLHLRREQKVRSAPVRIRYVRYAVQVATDTEKITYYPEEIYSMKKTTRRRNIEIKIEKITNIKGKREKKVQFRRKIKKS